MKNRMFDFSDKKRVFRTVVSHLTAMLSVMVIVFFIIDRVNSAMEFMSSDLSKWVIVILAALSLVSAVLTIVSLWDNPDSRKSQWFKKQSAPSKNISKKRVKKKNTGK